MLQTLLTIGPFQLRTQNLFSLIGFLLAGFIFWKRGREEHYSEAELFDGFLLSFFFGVLVGRLGYILLNWNKFAGQILTWVNLVENPGVLLIAGLIGAALYLFRYAQKHKWDSFEILDFWTQAVAMGLFWLNIGYFFQGARFGSATSLPWGVVFPGVFEKRHPLQLYYAVFHLVLFFYLSWLEFHYRSFEWYRGGKKTAQTGFLFIIFLIAYAVFSLLMQTIQAPLLVFQGVVFDYWLYGLMLIAGLWLLLRRSNRVLFSFSQKKLLAIKS